MAAYRRVYDSRHLCQEPRSALEPYARQLGRSLLPSPPLTGGEIGRIDDDDPTVRTSAAIDDVVTSTNSGTLKYDRLARAVGRNLHM